MQNILFVDQHDVVIGSGTKQEVWQKGIWHRIVRLFIFNSKGELLITRRAPGLASLPGRWDQSAAGHVDVGEEYREAAERELVEEVGISGVTLAEVGKTQHEDKDEPDKIKKRFSTLYVGKYDGDVVLNPDEVSEVYWIPPKELSEWMDRSPNDFTEGFVFNFKELKKVKSL